MSFLLAQAAVPDGIPGVVQTLLQYGALGVLVIVLGWAAWKKNDENKRLYDDRIVAERQFAEKLAEQNLRYREGMEKFNTTLDALSRVMGKIAGGG
jgi:hypothetical protein